MLEAAWQACKTAMARPEPAGRAGHVHAYERNYQTYNYAINGCAPRWLTMGDGGNQEGLYR